MAKRNFLLGKGERLVAPVPGPSGGGPKFHPYTFEESVRRLQPMLDKVTRQLDKLPADACPDENAIAIMTMNPEYIAKSYYPGEFLRTVGLEAVGSRARRIVPQKKSKSRIPEEVVTTELFLIGPRKAYRNLAKEISTWSEGTPAHDQIVSIEEITVPRARQKIKHVDHGKKEVVFEIVMHMDKAAKENRYLENFRQYLRKSKIDVSFDRQFYAGGLTFLEIEASPDQALEIARYSLVRVVREMPSLRMLKPTIRTAGIGEMKVALPREGPLDPGIKAAIFDGGIPKDHPITKWATPFDTPGLGKPVEELMEHGVGVTSAYLFGHIDPDKPIPRPFSYVDHYRVLGDIPGDDPRELYIILDRILHVLQKHKYEFINLSLGPDLPIDDDEVHAWTAVLDDYLAKGLTLAAIAVGNNGESDAQTGLNRIQVPADCVNALGLGACDTPDTGWKRAFYSSVGPGRSPGRIKPDLVDFGGSRKQPFLVLDSKKGKLLFPTGGTSFAAPGGLRKGTGVRAHFGDNLNPLAIRTLLVHCAEQTTIPHNEVGWGRIPGTLEDLVITNDNAVRIVYQGKITAAKYIRVPIPLPKGVINGLVNIKATICYTTPVDPHHPDNYTRSGLEISFRPHKLKRTDPTSLHAAAKSFFGKTENGQTEDELRRDAKKWENCQHAEHNFRSSSLNDPVFDIHYNARLEGHNDTRGNELQYAIVITVEAAKESDFYNRVVRKYVNQLEVLQPVIDIPIRTS